MTASDTKSPAKARGAVNAMQTYMTSLLYLRQEARRDGLDAVADILWRALAAIEAWLDSGQAPVGSGDILDAPLCQSLEFLVGWMALPPEKQRSVAQDIARYEAAEDGETTAAHPGRRVSRKTAS